MWDRERELRSMRSRRNKRRKLGKEKKDKEGDQQCRRYRGREITKEEMENRREKEWELGRENARNVKMRIPTYKEREFRKELVDGRQRRRNGENCDERVEDVTKAVREWARDRSCEGRNEIRDESENEGDREQKIVGKNAREERNREWNPKIKEIKSGSELHKEEGRDWDFRDGWCHENNEDA